MNPERPPLLIMWSNDDRVPEEMREQLEKIGGRHIIMFNGSHYSEAEVCEAVRRFEDSERGFSWLDDIGSEIPSRWREGMPEILLRQEQGVHDAVAAENTPRAASEPAWPMGGIEAARRNRLKGRKGRRR